MTGIPILDDAYRSERWSPLTDLLSELFHKRNKMSPKDATILVPRKDLFVCPHCQTVWQWKPDVTNCPKYKKGDRFEYLPHFPKVGQKERLCPKCEK